MDSMWRKTRLAIGMHFCAANAPRTADDVSPSEEPAARPSEVAAVPVSSSSGGGGGGAPANQEPTPTSLTVTALRLSKSSSGRSSKKTCAICYNSMKLGNGHALFTAECSHTFHFHCIATNVKHGNLDCPVCRAKWKEIPFQGPLSSELSHGRARVSPVNWPQVEDFTTILRRLPRADSSNRQHHLNPPLHNLEPDTFDDDELLDSQTELFRESQHGFTRTVEIETYPEFSAIPKLASQENFTILIHLKASHASTESATGRNVPVNLTTSQNSRAPVDLVTVLDVSGSMAGTKLALLKRAMGFVIQNLGPSDRLSVIAFSSTARRLFHLCRMTEAGRQQALQAVNSLVSSGGTNIAEGLSKGVKVIEERKEKNPVCSIILLSDGQDTYTVSSSIAGARRNMSDYSALLPPSIRRGTGHQIPVHAFGFGADHDSASMHSVSEASGGTFSFIEAEGVIQDAFAQCIGGLLSVVVQEMCVMLEPLHPGVSLAPIRSGSYASRVADNGLTGSIDVGDLYADEEKDFLVSVNVPTADEEEEFTLLKVGCTYRDPVSKEMVNLQGEEVKIHRPQIVAACNLSIEVDRERNRVHAAEAMADARAAAERGALAVAVSILEECREILSKSLAARSGDRLCVALDAELREMLERMASRQRYEASGRAYLLSGLSSHSWQRATARGDSTDSTSLVHAYQTPFMVDMLQRSQTLNLSPQCPNSSIIPGRRNPGQPPLPR